MRNYIIGTLGVIILVLVSVIYKSQTSSIYKFPALYGDKSVNVNVPLFLYFFFSKNNCPDCLKIIESLNNLPRHFNVSGIVPEEELKEEERELRRLTRGGFPLMSSKKYKKYIPPYSPAIMGVSTDGEIIFVLPGVPGEEKYLENFLDSLYSNIYPIFLRKEVSGQMP